MSVTHAHSLKRKTHFYSCLLSFSVSLYKCVGGVIEAADEECISLLGLLLYCLK